MFVPVVDKDQNPLMPTTPARARKWIKSGKATGFFKGHIFCVRLNVEPSGKNKQDIACGIDTGFKKEAFTIKSRAHTYLNIQADAINHIGIAIKIRKEMRKSRRSRKTPCRKPKFIQGREIPPSIKARWQWKLNILKWLSKLFPISKLIIEDVKAVSKKGKRNYNKCFNTIQVGKNWFYKQLEENNFNYELKTGKQTKKLRDELSIDKNKNKLSNSWSAHCIDSWVLANSFVGGNIVDNKAILHLSRIRLHRRQLHRLQPSKGGKRTEYGSTKSMRFKRGCIIKHLKLGFAYVGGTSKNKISLHSIQNGVRLRQNVRPEDCKFICYNGTKAFSTP